MARVHITIEIPATGPAQVSITTDDDTGAPALRRGPITQVSSAPTTSALDGGQLRATRMARGWTQAEMAKRIGCSTASVAQVEQGRKRLTEKLSAKIKSAGIVVTAGGNGSAPTSH